MTFVGRHIQGTAIRVRRHVEDMRLLYARSQTVEEGGRERYRGASQMFILWPRLFRDVYGLLYTPFRWSLACSGSSASRRASYTYGWQERRGSARPCTEALTPHLETVVPDIPSILTRTKGERRPCKRQPCPVYRRPTILRPFLGRLLLATAVVNHGRVIV